MLALSLLHLLSWLVLLDPFYGKYVKAKLQLKRKNCRRFKDVIEKQLRIIEKHNVVSRLLKFA